MTAMSSPQPDHRVAKGLRRVLLATAALLLLPAAGMLLTNEVNWGPGDFLAAAIMLGGTGSAYVVLSNKLKTRRQRIAAGLLLLLAMLTVWAELAVGILPG